MDNQCQQACTRASASPVCERAAPTITARPMVISWWNVARAGLWCIALSAALSGASMAQAPAPQRIINLPSVSVFWIEGIEPYDPACLSTGNEVAPLPPQLRVVYGEAEAFCTNAGNDTGRLTIAVTGQCRLVEWSGVVIESRCHWLPVVIK